MSVVSQAIQTAISGKLTFTKFLAANDTGLTGGHQAGIYISKPSISILFDEPGVRGQNKEKWVKVNWQDDFETETRFIYYGQGTRNEYRITNFGRGFPFLRPEYTGALFTLTKIDDDYYKGFVLDTENEIDEYLSAFGLTPAETNRLIQSNRTNASLVETDAIDHFIGALTVDFPSSDIMAAEARIISNEVLHNRAIATTDSDKAILQWTNQEYKLYRALEQARYGDIVANGFSNIDSFVALANQVLNRRKSRAGKSLEHHLAAIFDENKIQYTAQAVTEGNKRPDFIFPSEVAYHDFSFPVDKLTSLAAKTTCKDRWRQILNEADRLRNGRKYLCTLQQGISSMQMDEMEAEKVTLVVPKAYISTYPRDKQYRIWSLQQFVSYLREKQNEC